ncbi:M28 family peptidase [Umezawaea beigongshangensis]|uniref:M28 family peptidase n=1 Tax=Umezawaea beigongshangensis TaxID=2780383 RepID=UPI0018F2446E|nr:M28 family peptidase [Umezawaea beigongshangensis]
MAALRRRDVLAGTAALAGVAAVGLNPASALAATAPRTGASRAPHLLWSDLAVATRVRTHRAMEHLRVLSDDIGPRVGGTGAEHRARDHIARVLRDLRYDVTLQPFPVADKHLGEIRTGRARWQTGAAPLGARDASARGEVVDLGAGETLPDDLTGRVALFVGAATSAAVAAAARGAAAVLLGRISTTATRASAFSPVLPEAVAVPVLGIAQVHVERLRASAAPVRLALSTTHHANLTSYNVIADRRATFPGPDRGVVVVSAHYDSVPGSPGANDDGSGTVLCLELARVLRHLPTQKAVRFALWGSEEQGLVGSRHYVNQLADAEAARIAGCFQNDMVATSHDPATAYWLLSVDGGDNTTTSAVAAAAERFGYAPRVKGPTARGSSDHVPFHERGIAAANFSWRGEAGPASLEPIYHTPEDTIAANVSTERLKVSMELVGAAAYGVACRA